MISKADRNNLKIHDGIRWELISHEDEGTRVNTYIAEFGVGFLLKFRDMAQSGAYDEEMTVIYVTRAEAGLK